MATATPAAPEAAAPPAIAAWLAELPPVYTDADRARFEAAYTFAHGQLGDARGGDGEPLIDRTLGTAAIVSAQRLDPDSITAALLHVLPGRAGFDPEGIRARFGDTVASLIAGVAKMDSVRATAAGADAAERAAQAENLRKMLLAMVEDIRVVLIKLAERTQALRWLMSADEPRRRAVAREVADVYAPLANRLGVWQLKWELEDLSLRALEPAEYRSIAALIDERRRDREQYIEAVVAELGRELAAAGLRAEVSGRPKHIYSIYRKMRRKHVGIEALYDIRAVRVLVDSVRDCYSALGIVHQLWTPLPGEFDDYIAKPKANDYRSLHTAVIGPEGKALEVQIRTREMHRHSEFGVAAHWRYKEADVAGARRDSKFDDRIAWLRQILDWKDAIVEGGEWLPAFRTSLFTESIYVLTPQGKVIDLPRGSTPIDFAYAVHTSLGHRCRGARVDGQMVPLDYELRNGQQVEIIAAKPGGPAATPSRDWLNPDLGYVRSHRARAKVRQWFKAQQHDETVAQGRAMVERELARLGQIAIKLEAVAARAGFTRVEDFFAAFARDDIGSREVQTAIGAVALPSAPAASATPAAAQAADLVTHRSRAAGAGSGILIIGVDRLMTVLARCCKPAPPDPIVGFVTRGKGITVHRTSCINVERIRAREPERLMEANWGARGDELFAVDIVVEASDRQGLLRDLSELFAREKINVTAVNTLTRQHQARMSFTLEVSDLPQLQRALRLVRDIRGVDSAQRR
ncbi:MAG: bifunctional (p)ppGpp synthetase/guanosine-3',5'-bis(diphosphate) 3'-pyrophosphohydrolase [Proteobacteria bacterium]|jgi:GTP pyrophosphokinase|nr:bifunctional (p)ppGpp synthetase/guanosine-3',5'-bis(diphosphate) 3'-pyrophosphohydrolase [Pseudomonadota bacterium]